MKKLLIVFVALAALAISCDRNPKIVNNPDPIEFNLNATSWIGLSSFYGTGDVDQAVEYHEAIRFRFTETSFSYAWSFFGINGPDSGLVEGQYKIVGDSILLDNPSRFSAAPVDLNGMFKFTYEENRLVLDQGNAFQGGWPYQHLVKLDKINIGN